MRSGGEGGIECYLRCREYRLCGFVCDCSLRQVLLVGLNLSSGQYLFFSGRPTPSGCLSATPKQSIKEPFPCFLGIYIK